MNQKTYKRLLVSAKAEQIMNSCSVFCEPELLRTEYIKKLYTKNIDKEFKQFYQLSNQNKLIKTKYYSRDKRTFRLFTMSGYPNLITLSNPVVMKAMKSRFLNGSLAMVDYDSFEFKIIASVLEIDDFPNDIHGFVQEEFGCSRSDAKKANGLMFYGNKNLPAESPEAIKLFSEIRDKIDAYTRNQELMYNENGFVLNCYGRKIYPKNKFSIFNNIIQSTGSEILIDCVLALHEYLKTKRIKMMMHRFDSLFFDASPDSGRDLLAIKDIMENINPDIPLTATLSVAPNLHNLKGK